MTTMKNLTVDFADEDSWAPLLRHKSRTTRALSAPEPRMKFRDERSRKRGKKFRFTLALKRSTIF